MTTRRLANTIDTVTQLMGGHAPPVFPEVFIGGTRVTGRYVNTPFEAYVPAMDDHVVVAHLSGVCEAWSKIDGKLLKARSLPGTITQKSLVAVL